MSLSAQTPIAPPAPTLLAVLREGTRASHERVEAVPALACLMSPALTSASYVFALQALQAMHAGVASRLARLKQDGPATCAPDDAPWHLLAEDLAWFGARPRRAMAFHRVIEDRLAGLGALYVVEGSALGARVIGRAVAQSLGVSPGSGGSFFCSPTAEAARSRWLAVASFLTASGASLDADEQARVVAGARAVFDALAHAMQQPQRPPPKPARNTFRRSLRRPAAPACSAAQPPLSVPAESGRALT